MKTDRKLALKQLQAERDMYKLQAERSGKREEFLIGIVRQFHREVKGWGLEIESQATENSMCIYAGDWQCSIDMHLERISQGDK